MSELKKLLKDTADAIRAKKGTTDKINAQNFPSEISTIETGIKTDDATATAADILEGKTAYVKGEKITGTIRIYDGSYDGDCNESTNISVDNFISGEFPNEITLYEETIRPYLFQNTNVETVNLPNATVIGMIAFDGCLNLKTLNMPKVKIIEYAALPHCLVNFYIPDTVEYLSILNCGISMYEDGFDYYASETNPYFYLNGVNLDITGTDVILNENVKIIADNLFNSRNLLSIKIPKNVTYIGEQCFYCSSLTSITFEEDNNLKYINNHAFNGCTNLTSITIPDSVNDLAIGSYAFNGCTNLEEINLPNNTISIKNGCFDGACKLTSITIPEKVSEILDFTFNNCTALQVIVLKNVSIIYDCDTFNNCNALTDIYFGYNGVVNINSIRSLDSISNVVTIHVRSEYADQYATATNWSYLIDTGKITIVGDYND